MLRKLAIAYLVLAHLAGIGLLYVFFENRSALLQGWETRQEIYQRQLGQHYARRDRNVEPGAVLFLGASTVQGMDISRIADRGINFGIGGETMIQLAARASSYRSLQTARAVVVWAGYNDLRRSSVEAIAAAADRLVTAVPEETPVLLVGVQRVRPAGWSIAETDARNAAIGVLNSAYEKICLSIALCQYLDPNHVLDMTPGCRSEDRYEADGIHLSPAAYRCLGDRLLLAVRG